MVGRGQVLHQAPGDIFSIYTKQQGLKNGKVHYLSQDGIRTLEHACDQWKIAYPNAKPCYGVARTEKVNTCPSDSGHTWKYYYEHDDSYSWFFAFDMPNNKWKEAGEGLIVTCSSSGSRL